MNKYTEHTDEPYIYQKSKKNKNKKNRIYCDNIEYINNGEQINSNRIDEKNKRLMCNNILKTTKCCYGDKCVFAHSLKEQRKDPIRKFIYNIINKKDDVNNIEIIHDKNIIKILYLFTKKCLSCEQNKCPGGYNCNTGVISSQYILCEHDLSHGFCVSSKCNKLHLSKKGYVINKNYTQLNIDMSDTEKHVIYDETNNGAEIYNNVGVTLNDLFFYKINCIDQFNAMNAIDSDSDTESYESREKIKEYLNADESELYDESIFIFNNIDTSTNVIEH